MEFILNKSLRTKLLLIGDQIIIFSIFIKYLTSGFYSVLSFTLKHIFWGFI